MLRFPMTGIQTIIGANYTTGLAHVKKLELVTARNMLVSGHLIPILNNFTFYLCGNELHEKNGIPFHPPFKHSPTIPS